MAVSASAAALPCTSLVSLAPEPTRLSTPTPPSPLFLIRLLLLLLSPPLLPIGRTWKKGQICIFRCCISLHDYQHSDIIIIKYLLGVNKQRCGVLVNELIASIGVDMSHLCAVDVKRHLVLRDLCAFRVHGWALM